MDEANKTKDSITDCRQQVEPVIVVHGGAWKIPDHIFNEARQGVKTAAIKGYRVLENGGSCIDAVVKAVKSLEDDPYFDAGRGSDLNQSGEIEMHSMVMRGDTCDIGGVLSLKHVKNPVEAARIVLDESHHCLLDGEASLKIAREHKLEERPLEYFVTEIKQKEFKECGNYSASIHNIFDSEDGHDTVGAVALDCHGNLACATSTGGITAQTPGRVSDSALGGSGGFADNQSAAISTTGHGESIMKVNLARLISFHIENGLPPQVAVEKSLHHMKSRIGGSGGAIALDANGSVGFHYTTQNMSWARIGGKRPNQEKESKHVVEYGCDASSVQKEAF